MKLREIAYESFTQQLLARQLRPGQFVSQRELVALTGLSLGAIRELIPRLEAEGLIIAVPQRGMQIANLDMNLVRNSYSLRAILEVAAVKNFTQNAQMSEIEALEDALARITERIQQHKTVTQMLLDQALSVDWAFHDTLIDAMNNDLISGIYRINSIRIRLIRLENIVIAHDNLEPALAEHARIIAAMKERDVDGAVAAMEAHMQSARSRVMDSPDYNAGRPAGGRYARGV